MDKWHAEKQASNRSVLLVIGGGFLVLAAAKRSNEPVLIVLLAIAAAALLTATFFPGRANVIVRLWGRLGSLLGSIMNPIILGAMFLLVFTPLGFLSRRFGNTAVTQSRDSAANTYWHTRTVPGPAPETFEQQF